MPFWLSTVDSNVAIGNDKLASEEAAAVQLLSTKWTREQGWGKTVTRECNLSAQQIYFDRPATIQCFGRFNDDNKELGKLFLLIWEYQKWTFAKAMASNQFFGLKVWNLGEWFRFLMVLRGVCNCSKLTPRKLFAVVPRQGVNCDWLCIGICVNILYIIYMCAARVSVSIQLHTCMPHIRTLPHTCMCSCCTNAALIEVVVRFPRSQLQHSSLPTNHTKPSPIHCG